MRHGMPLAVACLAVVAGALSAQERIPLPAPDPAPAGAVPPPSSPPSYQAPAPPDGPPQPYVPPPPPPAPFYPPGPYSPYPPPSGSYPLLEPPPLFGSGPFTNPTFWLGADGLVWWTKNQPVSVPLVTTGPASQGANAGNLGVPGTTSLDGPLDYGAAGGFRLFAGGWFNANHTLGMDGSLFILGQQSAGSRVSDRSGAGDLVINEPVSGAPFVTQVSAPGAESGSVAVSASSRFGGGDLNVLGNLYRGNGWTVNLLGGYRYLQLDESLTVAADSNLFTTTTYSDNMGNVLATAPPGSAVSVIDQFRTRNQFNGGQVGAQFQYLWGRLSLGGAAKLAVGDTHEVVTVNGSTTVFPINAAPVPLTGGNYATLQIGRYGKDRFALAPEGQLNVGYQLTPCLRAQVGYDFLYLSNVARPGNQIDNTYDGVTHPLVPLASSSFWAQGLTLGLQLNF
ncbi:MAG TPA: BBP7 family outer membrane beta-barrel protein [Gemmataceae bacterium]|nr:BBP7 family outer membrane beta-barrel protein [Gemmataceae bacterium]